MDIERLIKVLTPLAFVLALGVVMLGAYTRLTHAGLGCPDWPGCYGKLVLPMQKQALVLVQQYFPDMPLESRKAWTEMAHRYAAGTLASLIFIITALWAGLCIKKKKAVSRVPGVLILLVIFQAMLGMWTVTLKLHPLVVMGHLLGGILIFSSLVLYWAQQRFSPIYAVSKRWIWAVRIVTFIVFMQIVLGGWVSANYAGIACIGFPRCNGEWFVHLNLKKAFQVWSPIGLNYQGGLLDANSRVTIQWVHRLGALITFISVGSLMICLALKSQFKSLRSLTLLVLGLLFVQVFLGYLNVVYLLPLKVAVAHNGVAALILASLFILNYRIKQEV